MKEIEVYIDNNFEENPTKVGDLQFDYVRGKEIFSFSFDEYWLREYGHISLSADLFEVRGRQYPPTDRALFGCFTDALPDRWGRNLLKLREEMMAKREGRAIRPLSLLDALLYIDDYARLGAFRFKDPGDNHFIADDYLTIPPLARLAELLQAATKLEKSEVKQELPDNKWIERLLKPGSSLGGARPKANVIGDNGDLYVAKFPSINDNYDVAAWEHFLHLLGREAGVETAETKLIKLGTSGYHTLLSKRFDRTLGNKRVHMASAMTLLGLKDGDNATSDYGYIDIAETIISLSCNTTKDLNELFRRVAFNICVGNSDDHFRNHAFLLNKAGWILSPAYDLNPTTKMYQSLLINKNTNKADLNLLYQSAQEYFIDARIAKSIIDEVVKKVSEWRYIASKLPLQRREINLFAKRIEEVTSKWLRGNNVKRSKGVKI